ncbi:MAG TPA: archease [Dehalococcoidales bacterium]|nr:archease [Dehalococcoidales bacterium]
MKNQPVQIIHHTADIGLRAFGRDLPEAFCQAARGMFSLITDLRKVRATEKIEIDIAAEDSAGLLVAWLNELLFYFDTRQWLVKKCDIREINDNRLKASIWGEKVDASRHRLKRGIKSATYHMLNIEFEANKGYSVSVILDI